MKRISNFWLSVLLLVFYTNISVQTQRHSVEHDRSIFERISPYSIPRYDSVDGYNTHETDNEIRHLLDLGSRYVNRKKRTTGELIDLQDLQSLQNVQDIDELNLPLAPKVNLELIPPWILLLLSNKQKEKEEKSNRVMTPRLGRDIEDDIECQRSRPPFAPRLGKKSLPFKPRLGRQVYDDVKC